MLTKKRLPLLSLMLIIAMMFMLVSCGGKGGDSGQSAEPADTEESAAQKAEVIKTLEEIDTEDMMDLPLQIKSITLYDDGTLKIVPAEDLLKNAETNNEVVDGAVYPFADSGKVKDFYLVRFGNGGYRTLICLMDDGTLSALSATKLIEDHIFIVMDRLTGRENYVNIKEVKYDDAFGVVGITEDDEEIELDFSLDF
ncbi:MAG: hypothetical protein MJ128_02355 [Mogibacterium sp.]|nr:hypothetical protein [Mogibacterium sp.]